MPYRSYIGYHWRDAGQYLFLAGKPNAYIARLSGVTASHIDYVREGNRGSIKDIRKIARAVRSLLPAEYRDFSVDDLTVMTQRPHSPLLRLPRAVRWPYAKDIILQSYSTGVDAAFDAEVTLRQVYLAFRDTPVASWAPVRLIHRINHKRRLQNIGRTNPLPMLHPYDELHDADTLQPVRELLVKAGEKPIEPKPIS